MVSYTYDPWGAPMSTDGTMAATLGAANPLRYRGYVYDTETGLYYLSSRYYNPVWGRFINADTPEIVVSSPGKVNWDKNLFAYCDNNPVNRQDNGGKAWQDLLVDALVSGVVSGIFGLINDGILGEDVSFDRFCNSFFRGFKSGFLSSFTTNFIEAFSPLSSLKRLAKAFGAIFSAASAFCDVYYSTKDHTAEQFNQAIMAAIVAIMTSALTNNIPKADISAPKAISDGLCKFAYSLPCEAAGSAYIAVTTCSSSRRTSGGKSSAPRQAAGRGRNTGPVRMTV